MKTVDYNNIHGGKLEKKILGVFIKIADGVLNETKIQHTQAEIVVCSVSHGFNQRAGRSIAASQHYRKRKLVLRSEGPRWRNLYIKL